MKMKSNKIVHTISKLKSVFSDWGFSWKGLKTNKNGEWWLTSQLLLLSGHLYPPIPYNLELGLYLQLTLKILASIIIISGIYISINSLIALGNNLSPLPEPKQNASLVKNKIYKRLRHPLYFSLIMISIGINLYLFSILHLILLILLSLILIGKAHSEERRLKLIYVDYKVYMQNTPAIVKGIPFFDWRE